MEVSESPVFYERSDASLLARTPAVIDGRHWETSRDWEDMRAYLEQVLTSGKNVRNPWWMHWGEIAREMLPRRYHWLISPNQMSRGLPINQDVVDSTPPQAINICAAGMMDGLCDPTKRWFKFQPGIQGIELDAAGQRWFNDLQNDTEAVLAGSNYYDAKHQLYEDEICFGTGPMLTYEDSAAIINCQNPCAGEYVLACGANNEIESFYREFTLTVRQIVGKFGPDAIAGSEVADLWNNKGASLDTEQVIGHAIEPNFPASQPGQSPRLGVVPGGYAYREYYWLRGKATPRPLSARGFHEPPFIAPRWNIRSNDPYGRGPGMDALPDVRQLNQMQRRFAEAIDKMVRPPMLADAGLKNEPSSTLPGRVTFVPNLGKDTGMRPTYTVTPQVEHMALLIEKIQQRVERWFYNDVFMMISQMEGVQPRNDLELSERRGEKLLRLGPVIERNLREDAKGLSRVVSIMKRRGLVRPKPPSLARVPVGLRFVSKLALIQQAAVTGSMERVLAMAGRMEGVLPGTLDNFDNDKYIRKYGEKLEFPPDIWADKAQVQQKRAARNKQQQAASAATMATHVAPAAAGAAKDLSETDTGGGMSALQMLLGGGGGAPAGAAA